MGETGFVERQDRAKSLVAWKNLFAGFEGALRLLHPFMPFLTEELWHQLPQKRGSKSIALGAYPKARAEWKDAAALAEFGLVQEMIQTLRTIAGGGNETGSEEESCNGICERGF